MKCELLDRFGIWGEVDLNKKDFKFMYNYSEDGLIQIWKGSNNDTFILKNISKS